MLRQIECIISGKVQGMFYRAYARRKAKDLGLVGTVQNLPNGTVHVIAQGDETGLEKYVEQLKLGSIFSRVESVDVKWSNSLQSFPDFSVKI